MKLYSFEASVVVEATDREDALRKISAHLSDAARLSGDGEHRKLDHEDFDGKMSLAETKKKSS
jgi:hypothetical protein